MTSIGKFITFEGGEGSGKSTQSRLLAESLKKSHDSVIHTREPGGTEAAEEIRALLVTGEAGRLDAVTETLLHFAARREHMRTLIRPSLEEGAWIVCDRFIHSTIAYQGYGHGLGHSFIQMLRYLTMGRTYPCLTFLLDVEPKVGLARAGSRMDNEDRYEKMDFTFHERVREGFLSQAKKDAKRIVVLDATQPISALHTAIIQAVNTRFHEDLECIA